MNNFSPSTDTSVGTKRFTAQEVQLAYTLMAVEYMKTIKGLNPNHQLVDKAVKLKALGFTNSKEVGDAITSEEDLKVLKCYSFLQRHFPGSLILKEEDFINLNVKYGLVVGRLSAYKGSVPDENMDENAGYGKTRKPVENIIWVDERKMLEGNYTVYVNNFCCRESVDTGFTLEIEYNGEVRQFVYDKPVKHKENVMVAEITYSKSKGIQIRELIPSTSNSSIGIWNIDTNKFHKVNVMSPNYWDEQGIGNKHYFFMLDDCKNPEPVRGFFNEYLNSELTPHRKVFEVLADKMKTPYQEHQLSGFSSTMRNSVIVKVDGTFSRTLKVNF